MRRAGVTAAKVGRRLARDEAEDHPKADAVEVMGVSRLEHLNSRSTDPKMEASLLPTPLLRRWRTLSAPESWVSSALVWQP